MNRKVKKLLAFLISLSLMFCLISVEAFAGDVKVAKIGETEYETLDDAVKASKSGDTIELLADDELDATLLVKGGVKSITFTGNGKISVDKKTIHDPCYTGTLTFDGAGVSFEWNGSNNSWLMLNLKGTLNVLNGAQVKFIVDSSTGAANAIYASSKSTINVSGANSKLEFVGVNSATGGAAIQLDSVGCLDINVTDGATFTIDGTKMGYVGSPNINVENATLNVINCKANGSNGGVLNAVNSVVNYSNNGALGLSVGECTFDNSTFIGKNNEANALHATGNLTAKNGSKIIISGNQCSISSKWTNPGAMMVAGTTNLIDETCTLTITENNGSGIFVKAGATLELKTGTITDNNADKLKNGGGIYNCGTTTIGEGVVICNNTAANLGDDIYQADGASITLPNATDEVLKETGLKITDWYEDGETPWSPENAAADMKIVDPNTYDDELCLKAAHGPVFTVTFMDGYTDEALKAEDVVAGAAATAPADPTRDGYTFDGWDVAFDNITEDTTVTAKWTENVIIDDDTPLGPMPPEDDAKDPIPEVKPAPKPTTPVVIEDSTPLGAVNTADNSPIALVLAMAVTGMAGIVVTSKKNKED